MKKVLSIFLTFVLMLSLLTIVPCSVSAADTDTAVTGIDESKIKYTVLDDGTAMITGYSGTDLSTYDVKELVIPSVLNGYTVTAIGDGAFFGRKMIGSLVIPDTVKSIGNTAFGYIDNLTTVVLGSSLETIGESAFSSSPVKNLTWGDSVKNIEYRAFFRSELEDVDIPDSVEVIGDAAFADTPSIKRIHIGKSVKSIGVSAFRGENASYVGPELSYSLESITVDGSNPYYDSRDNCGALIETATNTLIRGCRSTVIPDSVSGIATGAFYACSGLEKITIPDTVTSIAASAFFKCGDLKEVTIPQSVVSSRLSYCFNDCYIEKAILSRNVTSISDEAFRYTSVKNIEIPDTVTSIGRHALDGCEFEEITIPDSVTSIGEYAFDGCSKLKSIDIPDSVTSIGGGAFWGCTLFTRLDIPASVTYIGNSIIEFCNDMTGIYVDPDNPAYASVDGILYDKDLYSIIEIPKSITSVVIPDTVAHIPDYAFSKCSKLSSITLSASTYRINKYAFRECTSLTEINIPDSCVFIGQYAFYGCTALSKVTFGSSLKEIEHDAFASCDSLMEVTVPASVEEIGGLALGCKRSGNTIYHLNGFVIYGYDDTEAQRYAEECEFEFRSLGPAPVPRILGDADGSGEVDTVDATIIQRYTTMIAMPYDEEQLMAADVDGDGDLTVVDATFIQRYATKVQVPYPIGEPVA